MATKLAQKAGLAVFEKHMENYRPADPYYEVYVDKKGREKRRRVSRGTDGARGAGHWALRTGHCALLCMLTMAVTPSVIYLLDYQSETQRSSRVSTDAPTTSTKASTFVVCALGGLSCSVRHPLRSQHPPPLTVKRPRG